MSMNKLLLHTDIYSQSSIKETCDAYKAYARIKIIWKNPYVELIFDRCKFAPNITMKEFENYLINVENLKK